MKHLFFTFFLKISNKLSHIIQFGNPNLKAPFYTDQPDSECKIYTLDDNDENISIWRLYGVTCVSIAGGGVIDNKNCIYKTFTAFPWANHLHPSISLPYLGRNFLKLDKAIFLVTPEAEGNYYHWLTDALPRLLLINGEISRHQNFKILLHQNGQGYEKDTLAFLGISSEQIIRLPIFKTVKVEELLITTYKNYGQAFPNWKKKMFDRLKERNPQVFLNRLHSKVYLVRGNQKKRNLIGEEKLISVLLTLGFKIVDMQKLSLTEQMNTIANADVIIGLHGAALANIIFAHSGTKVIELRSAASPPEFYREISNSFKLDFHTINLYPDRVVRNANLANKRDLTLTDQAITKIVELI